jgi:hypothetical protein
MSPGDIQNGERSHNTVERYLTGREGKQMLRIETRYQCHETEAHILQSSFSSLEV